MTTHTVTLPNGSTIKSLFRATLTLPDLPEAAREVFIFSDEDLPSFNLLSVPQLTSAGLSVQFRSTHATVTNQDGATLLSATRHPSSDLYLFKESPHACVLFPKSASRDQKVSFFSASMGSPTASTLARAVTNGWVRFPGLTATMVRNQPHSEATSQGHLDRTRSGLDSTHRMTHTNTTGAGPFTEMREPRHTVYVDLTGRFPHMSVRGVEYLLCCRCSDSNYIHVEPLRSRNSREITTAFERAMKFFGDRGVHHQTAKIDNEVSNHFKETVRAMGIQLQLVPPDNHRTNPVERDIRTFKNHLLATLATTDPNFPLNEWDHVLPQVELTLNLMRGSHTEQISAFQHICGNYDFSRNPIAPVGTRVIILEDPSKRGSWAPHGVGGFYVGPAMDHYRSFRVLIDDTRRIRITDSLSWHPEDRHDFADIRSQMQASLTGEVINGTDPTVSTQLEQAVSSVAPTATHNSHASLPPHSQATSESVTSTSFTPSESPLEEVRNTAVEATMGNSTSPTLLGQSDISEPLSQATTVESLSQLSNVESTPGSFSAQPPRRVSGRSHKPNPKYSDGMFKFAGTAKSFKSACKGPDQSRWLRAADEEFDRLIETTETMKFVPWDSKPRDRKASYYNPQIRIKTKSDGSTEYRVRGTYGGDISDYQGPTAAQTADMMSIKILLNATVSEDAKFMSIDIKDFY
jgi:hypothetical protein